MSDSRTLPWQTSKGMGGADGALWGLLGGFALFTASRKQPDPKTTFGYTANRDLVER